MHMQSIYILFVDLSDNTNETMHNIILHFNTINLLRAVSKFYMKPIWTFYRHQELTWKQISTTYHTNTKLL